MNVLEKILEEIHEQMLSYRSILKTEVSGRSICEIRNRISELNWTKKIIISHLDEVKWIPCSERLPEDDNYILLSFENFSLPLVGRYEENENGGAFYVGDCDGEDTCVANDLFVNAWRRLPEPYKPAEPKQQKNTQQEMEDFWRDK